MKNKISASEMQSIRDGDRGFRRIKTIEETQALLNEAADNNARDIAEGIIEDIEIEEEIIEESTKDQDHPY
jgi:hypothetical protein